MKRFLLLLALSGICFSLSACARGDQWEEYSQTAANFRAYVTSFYNENIGMVGGHLGQLQKTTDGGATWNLSYEPREHGVRFDTDFIDEDHIYSSASAGLNYSSDGGTTWVRVSDELFYDISFADQRTGWCQTESQWFRSNDGFSSYEVIDIPDDLGRSIHGLAILSYDHAKVWSNEGILYSTLDGGKNWTSINVGEFISSQGYRPRYAAATMRFETADRGVLVLLDRTVQGRYLICETQNGGEKWTIAEIEKENIGRPQISRDLNVISLMENIDIEPEIFLFRRVQS